MTLCHPPTTLNPAFASHRQGKILRNDWRPNADNRINIALSSRLLSCIKVNTSLNSYFTLSLGWPQSSLYKVRTDSNTPLKETGYFLANLYMSNFHINKIAIMIKVFYFRFHFPSNFLSHLFHMSLFSQASLNFWLTTKQHTLEPVQMIFSWLESLPPPFSPLLRSSKGTCSQTYTMLTAPTLAT